MLRCINRLEISARGESINSDKVTDRASDIHRYREEVGMVLQSFKLFPHLTAMKHGPAPASLKGCGTRARDLHTLLKRVGLRTRRAPTR